MSKSINYPLIALAGTSCCVLFHAMAIYARTKRLHEEMVAHFSLCDEKEGRKIAVQKEQKEQTDQPQRDRDRDGESVRVKAGARKIPTKRQLTARHFVLTEIGVITSPFPLRAGTPRQGLLAPHSRSILTLHPFVSREALDDLEQYSHVWVIFQFHLNPVNKGKNSNKKKRPSSNQSEEYQEYQFKASKIKPPRAHGKKVGVFATRSPHRPNNIGLSLAYIESIETVGRKATKRTIVKLLGLDLVDGTPIYDIKPYIPSDSLPIVSNDISDISNQTNDSINAMRLIRTPDWVSNKEDKLASVSWTDEARHIVLEEQQAGLLSPLYPSPSSKMPHNRKEEVLNAISEIVAQDPRAQHDGREQSGSFEITFCTLRVCFSIHKDDNTGSCHAHINHIFKDPGDISAQAGSYQHNLALRRKAEKQAHKKGRKNLVWLNPVREGDTFGLLDLEGGGKWDVDSMCIT